MRDPATSFADASEAAQALSARHGSGVAAARERSDESEGGTLRFQFEARDAGGSVFTRESLLLMREIDELVMSVPGYEDVCQLEYAAMDDDAAADDAASRVAVGCAPRVTPVLHFFPSVATLANGTVVRVPDGRGELVADIDATVRGFAADERRFGYFLDGDFDPANPARGLVNAITRTKYPIGAPRLGFAAPDDREDEQEAEIGAAWLDAVEAKLFERFGMKAGFLSSPYMGVPVDESSGTIVRWYAGYLRSKDSSLVINYDLSWAGASVAAVWAYMCVHTGSAFVASLGMFEILMSFPVSVFIYRVVFGVRYLGNIQILSIFIVLGVGADDVFVFFDAWRQSETLRARSGRDGGNTATTLARVTYTSERASWAVFVTSVTTMMAFAATAMSEVMPIAAFGILSATMIFVLFVVNVLFFPPALVLYERRLKRWSLWGLVPKMRRGDGGADERGEHGGGGGKRLGGNDDDPDGEKIGSGVSGIPTLPPSPDLAPSLDVSSLGRIERFYHGPFFRFISHRVVRAIVVLGFASLFVAGATLASSLETPAEQERWYPSHHAMQAFSDNRRRFMSSDEDRVVLVDVAWGVRGMDLTGVDRWTPSERGALVRDERFDPTAPDAQRHLRDACDAVKRATCDAEGCGGAGGGLVRNGVDGEVHCPMEAFAAWVEAGGAYNSGVFPVRRDEFHEAVAAFARSDAGAAYRSHLGFEEEEEEDAGRDLGGESEDSSSSSSSSSPSASSSRLFYVRMTAESTLVFPTTARVSRPVFDRWEAWVWDELNANAPAGVANALQTGYFTWTWMRTQEALVKNTAQGLFICFTMAFAVLLASTLDLRVGVLATVTIAGVVVTVMGVGVRGIMRWDLGIGESIAAVILIGLSVDYCVHLANAYCEADPRECATSEARTQRALGVMGISITASAVTTVISGSILWLCVLNFFAKFAFLITATIASSFAWSVFFLPAALCAFGPDGRESWSSLRPLARVLARRWEEGVCFCFERGKRASAEKTTRKMRPGTSVERAYAPG